MIGVDSCVVLICTTRVSLDTRLNGPGEINSFRTISVELEFEIVRKESISRHPQKHIGNSRTDRFHWHPLGPT